MKKLIPNPPGMLRIVFAGPGAEDRLEPAANSAAYYDTFKPEVASAMG
jgi:hypothetical protein